MRRQERQEKREKKEKRKPELLPILAIGAEATLLIDKKNGKLIKIRLEKNYRHKILDTKLRKYRTRREAKIMQKLSHIIAVPFIFNVDEEKYSIEMEFIDGKKLSETLENFSVEERKKIAIEIGKSIALIHNVNIIHGDLTTSNMIYKDYKYKGNKNKDQNKDRKNKDQKTNFKVYFIDFGLAFHSERIEDKAVDVYLFSQALKSKHYKIWKEFEADVLHAYFKYVENSEKIKKQLEKVVERGRYKKQKDS